MNQISFLELNLTPKVKRAIDEMGFDTATSIQTQAIPIIRTGVDVIGRSQTGTGKTVAFAIPAIEKIDTHEEKITVQVLILCPTRELAQQACQEIEKLTKFKSGIHVVDVYGGAPMERQITRLKRANIVVGTPGRVMDHMRRKTLKLNSLKMVVLDEADEMLSMGFKEDIETILKDTPADRQTVLFSATMPPSILALTKQFQKSPKLIEIDKAKVTLDNIEQLCVDVPMGRKKDALNLLLRYYRPKITMIFCNTKQMVDEITEYLIQNGFDTDGLHGDMKQSQRTKVMDRFKSGKTSILVATDVAARGIDVNDIDYVINYDIPQNNEYYVHRIGRTGRAGKSGTALTICSGRRQVSVLQNIARSVKSKIKIIDIPSVDEILEKSSQGQTDMVEDELRNTILSKYTSMVTELIERGHSAEEIAAAALQLYLGKDDAKLTDIKTEKKTSYENVALGGGFQRISISIGRGNRVAPNHIVGAITERTNLSGKDIGKIEIFDDMSTVAIPSSIADQIVEDMLGAKICGKPVTTTLIPDKSRSNGGSFSKTGGKGKPNNKGYRDRNDRSYGKKNNFRRNHSHG
ncbi:MAG: DEAD/DEAH box helicase [Oscillospiraceae bacterium]